MRVSGIVVASVALVVAVAACGSGTIASPVATPAPPTSAATHAGPSAPAPNASAPTAAAPITPEPATAVPLTPAAITPEPTRAGPFTLRSGAFAAGGPIPSRYTCDGADISPDLSWTGVPDGTEALVLVVDDPDAGGFVHWIVLDMPPDQASLARGAGKAGGSLRQGTNDFGAAAWGGPCPPSGEHRYRFALYALTSPLGLRDASGPGEVRDALDRSRVLGKAVLEANYRRGG